MEDKPLDNKYIVQCAEEERTRDLREREAAAQRQQEELEELSLMMRSVAGIFELNYLNMRLFSMDELRNEYPQEGDLPEIGSSCIHEWCLFCVGSKLCAKIYKECYEGPSEEIEGHVPTKNIIVHFNDETAFTVLKYVFEWFLAIGLQGLVGTWLYNILILVNKPLDQNNKEILEAIYKHCESRLKSSSFCDKYERCTIILIHEVLLQNFCYEF